MKTVEYILEHGLESLTDVLGIVVKERGDLICLDYSQLESPKNHPVVLECRGLILEKDTWNIVFRSMERFFNLGEPFVIPFDPLAAQYFDKVDGSLIKIYNYAGMWHIATRGTVVADNETPFGLSFQDLVLKALQVTFEEFQDKANLYLNPKLSYNYEVTSIENRVVTRYEGYTLHFLSARNTETGEYVDEREAASKLGAKILEPVFKTPVTLDTVTSYVESLPDLKEGLVTYLNGIPICKVKSTVYVELHNKRGNGLSLNGIRRIVLIQEQDEYLSYFPEERFLFEPYIKAYEAIFVSLGIKWQEVKDIEDQKEFAMQVKDFPGNSLLFSKRRCPDKSFRTLVSALSEASQFRLLDIFKDA